MFHEALRVDPTLRDRFLDNACAGDIDLRIEVESLLISFTDAKSFLEEPVVGDVRAEPWQLRDGQKISHYRVVSPIASGGMGEVYLADDEQLNRQVALKVLPQGLLQDKERLRRFQREANVVSALNHPNILTIFEFGTDGGMHFLASEFVKGETLRERLEAGRLGLVDALEIGVQIASALKAAHEAGVVHRDIKPENVMIRDDGYVKVLDFGLAKLTERTEGESKAETKFLSRPGLILGTVTYMSPEQTRGTGAIDARSDFFSFGVMLFEMLTGHVPFAGETKADVLAAIIQLTPKPVSSYRNSLPAEIDRIVAKCLEKDRGDRYQHAVDLISDLRLLLKRSDSAASSHENAEPFAGQKTEIMGARETRPVTAIRSMGRRELIAAAVAGAVLLTLLIGGFWFFGKPGARQIGSIAVMPFVNESGIADAEYLCDGMTETLISSLARLRNLNVKARNTVFYYKGKAPDPKTLGRELSVEAVLLGRVVARGGRLTLFLELVDASTGDHIWGEQYNRSQSDLVALQNEVALDVSNKLRSRLSGSDEQSLTKGYTENDEAYQLYLKGRYFWSRRSSGSLPKAIEYFTLAIQKDPDFALAYSGLADAYVVPSNRMAPHDAMPKAKAAALRALEIDDTIAAAHTSLARVLHVYDWNWKEAEKEYRRAIELDPRYPVAHQWFGGYFERTGHVNESISERKLAVELDPLSAVINFELGQAYFFARDYDQAIEHLRKALELDPDFSTALHFLVGSYGQKGMYDVALARLEGNPQDVDLPAVGTVGYVYAIAGRTKEARNMLDEFKRVRGQRYVSAANLAMIHAGLGEKDEALTWLEKGYEERAYQMQFLKVDQRWDSLRDNPRFADLVRRLRFPE